MRDIPENNSADTAASYNNPPFQSAPTTSSSFTEPQTQLKLNFEYIKSRLGLIRILIIFCQFFGWVSAAAALPIIYYIDSRGAYLFFSIWGWLFGIFVTVIYAFNLNQRIKIFFIRIEIYIFVKDLLYIITTFFTSIFVAVSETNYPYYAKGALGSASFFGFCCVILYAVDAYHVWPNVKDDFESFFNRVRNSNNTNTNPSNTSNPPYPPYNTNVVVEIDREYQ